MRNSFVAAVLLVPALAVADGRRDLAPEEIRARVKAFDVDIGRCYRDVVGMRPGAGRLDITLEIHRTGIVDRIAIATPGLTAKLAKRVDGCVRPLLAGMRFPARRVGTVATVPYFYQRTAARGAGPVQSCWSAKGCKAKSS
jgi:hypothetical protein